MKMLRPTSCCFIAVLLVSFVSLVQNKKSATDSDYENHNFLDDYQKILKTKEPGVKPKATLRSKSSRLKERIERGNMQADIFMKRKTKKYVMALDNMKYIEDHLDEQKPRRNRSKFHVLRNYKDVSAADLLKLLRDAGK